MNRHTTDLPINITLEDCVSDKVNYLRNVSETGLCFFSKLELHPNQEILIKIPIDNPFFQAQARVMWCLPHSEEGFYAGVEFINLNSDLRFTLIQQVCYIEHYKLKILQVENRKLTSQEAAMEWCEKMGY